MWRSACITSISSTSSLFRFVLPLQLFSFRIVLILYALWKGMTSDLMEVTTDGNVPTCEFGKKPPKNTSSSICSILFDLENVFYSSESYWEAWHLLLRWMSMFYLLLYLTDEEIISCSFAAKESHSGCHRLDLISCTIISFNTDIRSDHDSVNSNPPFRSNLVKRIMRILAFLKIQHLGGFS